MLVAISTLFFGLMRLSRPLARLVPRVHVNQPVHMYQVVSTLGYNVIDSLSYYFYIKREWRGRGLNTSKYT